MRFKSLMAFGEGSFCMAVMQVGQRATTFLMECSPPWDSGTMWKGSRLPDPDALSDGVPQCSQHFRARRKTDSNTFFFRLNGSVPSAAAFHGFPGDGFSIEDGG